MDWLMESWFYHWLKHSMSDLKLTERITDPDSDCAWWEWPYLNYGCILVSYKLFYSFRCNCKCSKSNWKQQEINSSKNICCILINILYSYNSCCQILYNRLLLIFQVWIQHCYQYQAWSWCLWVCPNQFNCHLYFSAICWRIAERVLSWFTQWMSSDAWIRYVFVKPVTNS